jgi:hypothetical protein
VKYFAGVSPLLKRVLLLSLRFACLDSALAHHRQRHFIFARHIHVQAPPAPASFDSTTPRDERQAVHRVVQKHHTNSIHKQHETPSPAPVHGPLQRLLVCINTFRAAGHPDTRPSSLNCCLDSVSFTAEGRVRPSHTHRERRLTPDGSTQVRLPTRLRHPLREI